MYLNLQQNLPRRHPFFSFDHGQVLILGAAIVLIMAFVLFSTLGMAWKTQERIRLQHASDAMAYSEAVRVARAFNYFAYTNRAIASQLVSLTILHAYHSEISAATNLYINMGLAYLSIASQEIALTTCVAGVGPCQFGCFEHAIEDLKTAAQLFKKSNQFQDDIKSLDEDFESAVDGFGKSIQLTQVSQQAIRGDILGANVADMLSSLGASDTLSSIDISTQLKPFNLPAGENNSNLLNALNIKSIENAVEFNDDQKGRIDMAEVVNASRPQWVRNRVATGNTITLSPLIQKLKDETGGMWMTAQIPIVQGASGIYAEKPSSFPTPTSPKSEIEGQGIGSLDYWEITGTCKHSHGAHVGMQPFPLGPITPGIVYTSNSNSGHNIHQNGVEHKQNVNEWLRFMRFNISSKDNYNQPIIFKSAKQNLSLGEKGEKKPWDLFNSEKFKTNIWGRKEQINVDFRMDDEGHSLSKAMVYYHHPGNWREPPNFWNPFWHGKLHAFGQGEWTEVALLQGRALESVPFQILDLFDKNASVE